jgi:Uma2 family endonuclease
MVTKERRYTVAEFEALLARPENREKLLQLIAGEVVEKVPTQEHGVITLNIGGEIRLYFKENPIGRVGVEVRHRAPGDDLNDRLPDISVVLGDVPLVRRGPVLQMPDLAVEIKSPDDTHERMRASAAYYLAHGTRLVWLVYPERQQIEVCTPDGAVATLGVEDTLDGGEVLPGFTLAVRAVFAG